MPLSTPGPETTPGRHTRIIIGRMASAVTQMPFVWQRFAAEIYRGTEKKVTDLWHSDGIGLRIKAYQDRKGALFESSLAQGKFITGTMAQIAPNWQLGPVHRQYSYPGLNYVDPGASTTMPMYEKLVPAGTDWDVRLEADELAFPAPPDNEGNTIALDRVFKSTEVHYPDQKLWLNMFGPFSPARGAGMGRVYFSGIPGYNKAGRGTGQYCVRIFMEGTAILYERCKTYDPETEAWTGREWVGRAVFQPFTVTGADFRYFLTIESDATESCRSQWSGSVIQFRSELNSDWYKQKSEIMMLGDKVIAHLSSTVFNYKIPQEEVHAPELEPVRLDFRRDMRGLFSVSMAAFPPLVEFDDDPFSMGQYPTKLIPIRVEWWGDFPAGTGCEVRLYDLATKEELLDGAIYIQDCKGGAIEYPQELWNPIKREFYARIKLTSTGTKTPTLTGYRVVRRGTIHAQGLEVISLPTARASAIGLPRQEIVDAIDIDDGTDDPIQEAATVQIADFTAEMPELGLRVRQPVDIEIWDGADPPAIVTKLARFYINPNRSEQIRGERWSRYDSDLETYPAQDNQYPKPNSRKYTLTGNGEATRLKSMLFPHRWSLVEMSKPAGEGEPPPSTPGTMKVTDGLFTAFSFAGYSDNRIDVPDLPIRFFPGSGGDAGDLVIEPFSPIYDWVVENARDYLGGWPVFDLNAGDNGMWRILQQKRPPYNVVMRFTGEHPGALKAPHVAAAYGYAEFENGEDPEDPRNGQISPYTFIDSDDSIHIEPPEGNCVLVLGGVPQGGAQSASQLQQFIFNPVSCNFFNLPAESEHYPDENSPDFMGGDMVPIVVIDSTLSTPEAVNWIGRRVFDYSCFAREYRTFHAPMRFIVDVTDTLQAYPRRVRFGDVVEVLQPDKTTWRKYLVVRCSPSYSRDGYQFARYELVTSSVMDRFGMPVGMFDFFTLEELRRKALYRRQGRSYRSNHLRTSNRKVELGASSMVALPSGAMAPIQNIDPESEHFGTFNFMPDYDPVP